MRGSDGAEQYGGEYPTGNISSEDMDKLDARAAKAPQRSAEEVERFLESQTKSYRNRRWN
jgi:hypothetical protein